MRQALSLRGDRSRLSIEGALTGAALALTLAFLMQRPVEAIPLAAEGEDSREEGLEGGPNQRLPFSETHGSSVGPPAEAPASRDAGIVSSAGVSVGAGSMTSTAIRTGPGAAAPPLTPRNPLDRFSAQGPRLTPEAPASITADSPPPPAGGAPAERPNSPSAPDAAPAATPPPAPASADLTSVSTGPTGQRLGLVIDQHEAVVARSVEGTALAVIRSSQVGVDTARLDLSAAWQPVLALESLRRLDGLALSVLDTAELRHNGGNTAVAGSAIEGGSSDGSYRIQARDALIYEVRGGGQGRLEVDDRVVGLQNSQFHDAGGQDSLSIGAELALTLGTSSAGEPLGGRLTLSSTAVDHSTIRLGDGEDAVRISSRLSSLTAPPPYQEAQSAPILDLLRVASRAVGMGNSLLSTGGGDDIVLIEALGDGALGSESVALEDSTIRLGAGDDRLDLRGDLLHARIEPGSGLNAMSVAGAVEGLTVVLDPGGSTSVVLADGSDSMVVEGAGGLLLRSAGGNDRITINGRPLGWLDGGSGLDVLALQPAAEPAGSSLPAVQLTLLGVNRGQLDDLGFQNVERLELNAAECQVLISPAAALEGELISGGGDHELDYGTWKDAVQVDLGSGSATAIGRGLPGGIAGIGGVRGGQGDDHLVAGSDTRWMDGGPGVDWLEFDPMATRLGGAPLSLRGGAGSDLFVLAGLEPLLMGAADDRSHPAVGPGSLPPVTAPLPSLRDLLLTKGPQGQLELSDRLAWRAGSILSGIRTALEPQLLTPSGLEGLGQARMLPIAPLEALLTGIGSGPPQLAIATGSAASELVLLGGGRPGGLGLAQLPSIQIPGPPPPLASARPMS